MIVAAVTLGFLRLAARRSAAERSTIAHLGLCALLGLPLVHAALLSLSTVMPAQVVLVALQAPVPVIAAPVFAQPATAPTAAGLSLTRWTSVLACCVYLLPAVALLSFVCAAVLRLFRLRAHAQPVIDPVWLGALARAQGRMGLAKDTALLCGGDIASPISWGLIRPIILLNRSALAAGAQAEAIIAHELAHVIHHDWIKLILARVVTAAFWFNPLAWMLAREAHQLREEAADDAVLAADIDSSDYASLLIGVARCEARSLLAVVHGVAPHRSSLRRRITRVLDEGSVRTVPGTCQIAALTTATLVLAAPLAALRFEPASPRGVRNAIVAASAAFVPANTHEPAAPASPQSALLIDVAPIPQPSAAKPSSRLVTSSNKHRPHAARSTTARVNRPRAPDADTLPSQVSLDQLPEMLRTALDSECIGNGGTPGRSPDLFKTADLNGDGIPDLVFDRKNYECHGAASPVGPSRFGTTLTIFVGGPANSVAEVYTGSFEGSRVENGRDGKPSLTVAAPPDCGKPDAADTQNSGAQPCRRPIVFDTSTNDFVLGTKPITEDAEDR
jgi:beta-lactamase regulating signal transducer with metallopeptidase domain